MGIEEQDICPLPDVQGTRDVGQVRGPSPLDRSEVEGMGGGGTDFQGEFGGGEGGGGGEGETATGAC